MIKTIFSSYLSLFGNFFSIFNIENLKNWETFLGCLASIATIFLVIFSSIQIRIFIKDYKDKNRPRVIPYLDSIIDGKSVIYVLKFYNSSKIVAQNVGIEINKEWLNLFKKIDKSFSSYLEDLSLKKDIYITSKQEHSYLLGTKRIYPEVMKIPLIITIKYYQEKKVYKEVFKINLESISGKISNPSEYTRNKLREIESIEKISKNLNNLTRKLDPIVEFNYNDLEKEKKFLYYKTFKEFYPEPNFHSFSTDEIIKDIDDCILKKEETTLFQKKKNI